MKFSWWATCAACRLNKHILHVVCLTSTLNSIVRLEYNEYNGNGYNDTEPRELDEYCLLLHGNSDGMVSMALSGLNIHCL